MNNTNTFLDQLTASFLKDINVYKDQLTIVLPNKRAKIFLLDKIKNNASQTIFAPNVISVDELIQDIAQIRAIDSIELLFELYHVYLSLKLDETNQSFNEFAKWGKTLIQDFNEIDRYLIDPNYIFSYLSEIKALERWDLDAENKTKLIDDNFTFWKKLPTYYHNFYKHLRIKSVGYQGLIYRESVSALEKFIVETNRYYVFAGFNALNNAEEIIVQKFIEGERAKIIWDIDEYFLLNDHHDVGLFLRRYKKDWKFYKSNAFDYVNQEFQNKKNIEIIGTPKSIGQAKIAGKIIENLINNGSSIEKTAIVLGDENLLLPVLNNLPNIESGLNITMGFSAKSNPIQLLLNNILKLHITALNRSNSSYTFYYRDVLSVLNNVFVEPILKAHEGVKFIKQNNFTFFNYETFISIKEFSHCIESDFFKVLFQPWNDITILDILNRLKLVLDFVREDLILDVENQRINITFLHSVYKELNKIISYQERYNYINNVDDLQVIFKQIQDLAEVSFEGEPLTGLQIMGVLESRVLDFENVIITSVNEGKFPSGKAQMSFIPYDVKREIGLPTNKEKDAIYSYHFYHLLFRAKNVYLLYNTDSEGIDAGEKSRFLQQLEIETLPQHNLKKTTYNAVLPERAYEKFEILKSDLLLERLKSIATEKGFSPSSLTNFIRDPKQFYLQRVLSINDVDDVEENIAVNTLGTIIHNALEKLYTPLEQSGKVIDISDIDYMISKIDQLVEEEFKIVYKQGNIRKGKNFIAFEVAKRNIYNLLQLEKEAVLNGEEIQILALEKDLSYILKDENLPFEIKIAGKVDRIEKRNNKIRIIDYKTGKVEARSLKLKDFSFLMDEIKNDKIIQLLCYALMLSSNDDFKDYEVEAGIISFKNLGAGFLPFLYNDSSQINESALNEFKITLIDLLNKILNPDIPFLEQIK